MIVKYNAQLRPWLGDTVRVKLHGEKFKHRIGMEYVVEIEDEVSPGYDDTFQITTYKLQSENNYVNDIRPCKGWEVEILETVNV